MIAVVGAGLAGAVLARQLSDAGEKVVVFEARDHVAGNCHTQRDTDTGVMLHVYGPHVFHTKRRDVWSWMQRWGAFQKFETRFVAVTKRGMFSLPLNLLTLNQFFGTRLRPDEMRRFLETQREPIRRPANFEEQALSMVGRALYENFFRGYTVKQWGCHPKELPASILKRLPMRFDYRDDYFDDPHQGIPVEGYTPLVDRMLRSVEVRLSERFCAESVEDFDHVFSSAPLDAWFGHSEGRLGYRTVTFEHHREDGDHQGSIVHNYAEESVPWTRVTEHKHFAPWEAHRRTIWTREYSKETRAGDTPFYPKRLAEDRAMVRRYMALADASPKLTFMGRLGTYRYLNMDRVVGESLDLADAWLGRGTGRFRTFSVRPVEPLVALAAK